ncbi:ribonuclease Y [Candidatus Peregrinibacteria bacterium]|jgi:ribonucrease Y|nr:ribonuclease Y [Candidatus Peregrinibacteria bacterium]MBT7703229.1 ribonuclease Y [Candidatus Peregrinibacteria bacterium]
MTSLSILLLLVGLGAGLGSGRYVRLKKEREEQDRLEDQRKRDLHDAQAKAKEMVFEARSEALKIQEEAKKEEHQKRLQLEKIEKRIVQKEELLDKKMTESEKSRSELEKKVNAVRELKAEVEKFYQQQKGQLERVASLSKEEARDLLLKKVQEEAKDDLVAQIKKTEKDLRDEANDRAKFIIVDAIQKYAAETTMESTATTVNIPSDDMKGRIIGREGRNINTFEEMTGIDVIVDDTPGSIVISGFDLVRRYIAKIALERLLEDGRIHPARIEEVVKKAKDEVGQLIKDLGEKAVYASGVAGLPPGLVKLLGRLKFRTTYGQNVLKHSMEVALLAASLATELGGNVDMCRKAGLLHDIGKALDHEIQGPHAAIGRDILNKFGLSKEVIHCVEAHEGEIEAESIEAKIIQAANLISRSRPGADKDNLENFIKRLREVENVANEHEGVKKSYAVQAGRQVRVFVEPTVVDDLQAAKMAHRIAAQIEDQLQFPGEVKVEVFRETRVEDVAK